MALPASSPKVALRRNERASARREAIRIDARGSGEFLRHAYHPAPSNHSGTFRKVSIEIVHDDARFWRVKHRVGYRQVTFDWESADSPSAMSERWHLSGQCRRERPARCVLEVSAPASFDRECFPAKFISLTNFGDTTPVVRTYGRRTCTEAPTPPKSGSNFTVPMVANSKRRRPRQRLPRSRTASTLAPDASASPLQLPKIEPCGAVRRAVQTQPHQSTRNELLNCD